MEPSGVDDRGKQKCSEGDAEVSDVQVNGEPACILQQQGVNPGEEVTGELAGDLDTEKLSEDHEEGEISDDNKLAEEDIEEADDKSGCDNQNEDAGQTKEVLSNSLPDSSKSGANVVTGWAGRKQGWNWRSESSQPPEQFYQIAWAKGIQGSSNEAVAGTPNDSSKGSPGKATKTADTDSTATPHVQKSLPWSANRNSEYLTNRNATWMLSEGAKEYGGCFYRNSDGYLIWIEGGDRSEQRRSSSVEARKARGDPFYLSTMKGIPDRSSFLKSTVEKADKQTLGSDLKSGQTQEEMLSDSSEDNLPARSVRHAKDGREEGELEEGEIEGVLLGQNLSSAELATEASSGKQTRHSKDREKQSGKLSERSSGWRHSSRDAHKECTELLRNVGVKDAQKSFVGVCKQLYSALKLLRDLFKRSGTEGNRRRVPFLIRQAFSGIRAAYAARNTAVGKDQMDVLPRLLKLARFSCEKLFTSKQLQELETMMQTIGFPSKMDQEASSIASPLFEGERGEVREDSKFLESFQPERESMTITNVVETVPDFPGGTEQGVHPSAGLRFVNWTHMGDNGVPADISMAANTGFGGWFSFIPEQVENQPPAKSPDLGPLPYPSATGIENSTSHAKAYTGATSGLNTDKSKRELQELSTRSYRWPSHLDPVSAATSYHERFAGKSQMAYTRLPSPTPSEDDAEAKVSDVPESSVNVDGTEYQSKTSQADLLSQEAQPTRHTFLQSLASHPNIVPTADENNLRLMSSELRLFPCSEPAEEENKGLEDIKAKAVHLAVKGPKKNRDPRRKAIGEAIDLNITRLDDSSTESLERVQTISESSTANPVEFSESETPGPDYQHTEMNFPSTTDGLSAKMDIDLNPTVNLLDSVLKRERQFDVGNEETANKRPKMQLIANERDGEGLQDLNIPITASVPMVEHGVLVPHQTGSVRTAIVLRSKATDPSKHRMKPRDPRRVLLGNSLEKSGISDTLLKNNSTISASKSGAIISSAQKVAGSLLYPEKAKAVEVDSQVTEDLTRSVDLVGSSSSTSSATEVSSVSQDTPAHSAAGSSSRPEDVSRASKVSRTASVKVSANGAAGKLDLNVSAGVVRPQDNSSHWDNLEHLLEGLDEKQKQAVRQERARRIEEQSRMFSARKLCLVLDLDHTLLNSAKFIEIEEEWKVRLRQNEATECSKINKEGIGKRELYCFPHMNMWTKLRPGIWNFLARASQLYELHVYTMGNKAYASEMAKLLDPTGALFAGRVISKGDDSDGVDGDEKPLKSKDLDGVLGMESAVVIIDDSARVWPHHRHNLIVVERYMYFPSSRKQFGLPGPSLLEMGHDEREQDGMLASALMVIQNIHYSFFSNPRLYEVDVRDILAKEQRRVLAGCKVVFSRVFPQGYPQPHLHPLWQLAEQFGAVCAMGLDDEVTHVVAISMGTDKVNWAMATGKFVVRPSWLEASAILYRRANERDFPVPP